MLIGICIDAVAQNNTVRIVIDPVNVNGLPTQVAMDYIDGYLEDGGSQEVGFEQMAELMEADGRISDAIIYRAQVILTAETLLPEHYLKLIDNLETSGRHKDIILWCDHASQKLGPVLALDLKIVDTYKELGEFDKALSTLDRIIIQTDRKEKWYFEKALINASLGRKESALQNLQFSLTHLNELPQRTKMEPDIQQLAFDIMNLRDRLLTPQNELSLTGSVYREM